MDTKTEAIIKALQLQRNQALDVIAFLQGEIAELSEKLKTIDEDVV